jgi:NAD(P)-dependent dehydrogenase (short-subunit alcohol dehydrogenase family)
LSLSISLTGRHAAITGGASGIGLAIARTFRDCGAAVTILDVNGTAVRAVASTEQFAAHEVDVSDGRAMRRVAADVDATRPVDIVVAAAGVLQRPLPAAKLPNGAA